MQTSSHLFSNSTLSPSHPPPSSIFLNPRTQFTLQSFSHCDVQFQRSFGNPYDQEQVQNFKQNGTSYSNSNFGSFVKNRTKFKPSKDRQKFIDLNQEMLHLINFLEGNCSSFSFTRFLNIKEKIILRFANDFTNCLSLQNKDKAQFFIRIWNNLLQVAEKCFTKVCQFSKVTQKVYLINERDTHQKYQKFLNQQIKECEKLKQERQRSQNFMKVLVSKLRQYKKSMKKMEQSLRIAADKLNQFRRGYLQVQIECINLTMQLKNIGEDSAKEMVRKKMALIIQRSKQYKILPSKKKMRKQFKKNQIEANRQENLTIKEEFFEAFNSLQEKPQALTKTAGRAIDIIIEKQQIKPIDYSIFSQVLVEKHQEDLKVDKQTDMKGFDHSTSDKKVWINAQQRFLNDMTRIKGIQTIPIQQIIPIKTNNFGIQCNFLHVKLNRLSVKKTYDISFLFENKTKIIMLKEESNVKNQNFKSQKLKYQIHQQKQKQFSQTLVKQMVTSNNQAVNKLSSQPFCQETKDRLKQRPQNFKQEVNKMPDTKRRIRKIASSFNNKASLLNDFLNQNNQKQTISDLEIVDEYSIKQIQGRNLPRQPLQIKENPIQESKFEKSSKNLFRQTDKIKLNQEKIILNQGEQENYKKEIKLKKFQNRNNQRKSAFYSQVRIQKYKKSQSTQKLSQDNSIHVNFKSNKKTNRNLPIDPTQRQRSQGKNKNIQIYEGIQSKQLNMMQNKILQQITQEIEISKQDEPELFNKSSKIKGLRKLIDDAFQSACKELEKTGRLRNYTTYFFEAINNLYVIGGLAYAHRKGVACVKQIFQQKSSNQDFKLFLTMIGLDQQGSENYYYSNRNNEIILALAKKLSTEWKYPLKLSQLTTQAQKIQQNVYSLFGQFGFCQSFLFNLSNYVRQKGFTGKKKRQIIPIMNVILTYLATKQNIILRSYEPILALISDSGHVMTNIGFVYFLIELHFLPSARTGALKNKFKSLKKQNFQEPDIKSFAYFCCQNQILDFSRLYYRALNIFGVEQSEECLKSISFDILKLNSFQQSTSNIIQGILKGFEFGSEKSLFFHSRLKKDLCILLYLKICDHLSEGLVENLIGANLNNLRFSYCAPAS